MSVLWVLLLVASVVVAAVNGRMPALPGAIAESAGRAVTLSIGLVGVLSLWLGLMKVAEEAGLVALLGRLARPVLRRLFPGVPADSPAMGAIVLNVSANALGLGNAATPFGLRAMEELERANPHPGTATDAQALLCALNTASVQLIPATVIAMRPAAGRHPRRHAARLGVRDRGGHRRREAPGAGLPRAAGSRAGGGTLTVLRSALEAVSTWAIPLVVAVFPAFLEGAREGFQVALRIIPPLVAVFVALGMLRASGAMDVFARAVAPLTSRIGIPASVLPLVLVRPLSGGAAWGVVGDVLRSEGPDGYAGRLASVMAGSTETTFYVLAVYFGAVGITRYRQPLPAGLLADLAGFAASVAAVRLLFGP